MPFWHRIVIAAIVFAVISLLARFVDWWLARRPLPPEAATRYRVLRRTISVAIVVVGLFSALLVIPEVRAIAGGLLACVCDSRRDDRRRLPTDARQLRRRPLDRDYAAN